jgi:hypothetical protein
MSDVTQPMPEDGARISPEAVGQARVAQDEIAFDGLFAPAIPPGPAPAFWTVERVAYAVALVVGVGLRLWALGAQPLSTWEASNSWPAWLVAQGFAVPDAPAANSPLFYVLQWLLFWSGVNSDGGARFASAVAGAMLIALPWWWRGWLGRRTALVLAFFFALDGWLLAFARMADGASSALLVGLLLLVSTTQVAYALRGQAVWRRTFGVALGLLVISGPMGWNFLVPCALLVYLVRARLREARLFTVETLIWSVGSAVAVGTFLGARPDGLAWLASGASVWLAQFDGGDPGPLLPLTGGVYGLMWPWLRVVVEMAAPFGLGLAGFMVLWRQGAERPMQRPLVFWLVGWGAWGVLLWLAPGRGPFALPMLGIPMTILAAVWVDALFRTRPNDLDWREAGAVMITLIILLTSGGFWLTAWLGTSFYEPSAAQAVVVIFGMAAAILVAFAVWSNRREAGWVAAVLVAGLLMVWSLRGTWRLNYSPVTAAPAGWQYAMGHPEVRILMADIETLSAHRTGDPQQVAIQVQMSARAEGGMRVVPARPDPLVGWQLRKMRNLVWVNAPEVGVDGAVGETDRALPLVVTTESRAASGEVGGLPEGYGGSVYHVESIWLPSSLVVGAGEPAGEQPWGARLTERLRPWWRWLIYREASQPPQLRDVNLWAPLD